MGLGFSSYESNTKQQFNKQFILLYEPSMTVTYRFFRYFGVSAGLGYRLLLLGNKKIHETINSPTYSLGLNLFFGTIYKDFKKIIQ